MENILLKIGRLQEAAQERKRRTLRQLDQIGYVTKENQDCAADLQASVAFTRGELHAYDLCRRIVEITD